MAACGHNPLEALERLKSRLKVRFYLKDVAATGAEHNRPVRGKGIGVDIPGVMRKLKAIYFRGLIAIEYEKEGDVNGDMTGKQLSSRAGTRSDNVVSSFP